MQAHYTDNTHNPGLTSGWTGARGDIGPVNTADNPIPLSDKLINLSIGIFFYSMGLYLTKKYL
jgi:hypothetical protein